MRNSYFIIYFLFFCLTNLNNYAQTVNDKKNSNPYNNPVITAHYPVAELLQIEQQDSAKFNAIVYYYTQSFMVEAIICDECPFVDLNTVDVSKYEYLRKKSERYIRDFYKYGIKITLLSIDELKYKLPIHNQ